MQSLIDVDAASAVTRIVDEASAAHCGTVVSFRIAAGVVSTASPVTARPRMLYRLFALLLSLVVAFAAAEIVLRVCGLNHNYTYPMGSFFVPDDALGYHGKANFTGRFHRADFDVVVQQNADGFRSEEPNADSLTSAEEVYVLGDSFVWGYGIGQHDLMTNQMARLLGRRVHNFGLIGAGTVQEYMIFQTYIIPRLRSGDTVVLVFFGNDFGDNIGKHLHGRTYAKLDQGRIEIVPPSTVSAARQWKNWMKDFSCVFNLATYCIDRYRDGQWTRALGDRTQRRAPSREEVLADTADGSDAVLITRHYLTVIRDECRAKQARFLAAFVPGQAELNEDDVTSTSDLSPPEEIASRAAFDRLTRELEIETVDLLGPMLAAKQSARFARLTFVHDFHWNEAGNTVAAETIAQELRRNERN